MAGAGVRSAAFAKPSPAGPAPESDVISMSYHGTSRYQSQALASWSVSVALETSSGKAKSTGIVALTTRSLK